MLLKSTVFASTTLTLKKRWSLTINRLRQLQRDQRRNLSSAAIQILEDADLLLLVITLLIMTLLSSISFIHGLDVLVIAWILFCLAVFITRTMMTLDKQKTLGSMPLKLYGSHSLSCLGLSLRELKVSMVRL